MATIKKTDKQRAEQYQLKLDIVRNANEVNPFESKTEQLSRIARGKKDIFAIGP